MTKKHLLIFSPGFPKNEEDTRCIPAMQLFLDELNQSGKFDLTVLSFHYPYKSNSYNWKGIQVHALGGNNRKGFRRIRLYSQASKLAKQIHAKHQVDHVHSFWLGECAWLANKLANKWGIKHSCTLMGQEVFKNNSYVKKLKPMPELIALSQFQAQVFKQECAVDADQIIPWGAQRINLPAEERSIDVLGVGNLTELKSFDRFIRIVAMAKKQVPNIKAIIIGEGDQRSLREHLKKEALETNIQLLGVKSREEVLIQMNRAKCLLHCAKYESFGMVLIEALSCGMQVFSTAVGIAPELKEANLYVDEEMAAMKLTDYLLSKSKSKPSLPYDIEATVKSYINNVF